MKLMFLLSVGLLLLTVSCDDGKNQSQSTSQDSEDNSSACPWDEDNDRESASVLELSQTVEGYLCPQEDVDWYEFEISAQSDLATVHLGFKDPISPLNLVYEIYQKGSETVVAKPEPEEAATTTAPLSIVHKLEPGKYEIGVYDQSGDGQDVRHPYELEIEQAKDKDSKEPNNTEDTASSLGSGGTASGYISYRGDEDRYKIESPENGIVKVELEMPAGGIEPAFTIVDAKGATLITRANESGKREATDLEHDQALRYAGECYVVVHDNDKLDADLENEYTLKLTVEPDPDTHEFNNNPETATDLGSFAVGASWGGPGPMTGYIGSSGDVDWYKMSTQNSQRGILEVKVDFAQAGLPSKLQAAVRIIRAVTGNTCENDQDCHQLQAECKNNMDCSQYGNNCLPGVGRCAGSGYCLPSKLCGSSLLSESAPAMSGGEINSNRGTLGMAAPLFGSNEVYIVVEDFQGDSHSRKNSYRLTTRVMTDPDSGESFEAYTAGPPVEDDVGAHKNAAKAFTVVGSGECSNAANWQRGYLSYSYDQDWYSYAHPCPEADCMLRVNYSLGAGPVDFYFQVFRGNLSKPWFDTINDVVDSEVNSAVSGEHFGDNTEGGDCFYAYQGDKGDFSYYLSIRDTTFLSKSDPAGGKWDWSPEQQYSFCIEKLQDGCVSPCYLRENGCDTR